MKTLCYTQKESKQLSLCETSRIGKFTGTESRPSVSGVGGVLAVTAAVMERFSDYTVLMVHNTVNVINTLNFTMENS